MVQDLQDGDLGIFACVRLFESDWDSTASTICVCGLECARLPELGQTPVALRGSDNPSCQLSNILLENGRQNLMFTLFTPGL